MSGAPQPEQQDDAAELSRQVLDKLRAFVLTLDDEERGVLAALLAPGVARAYAEEPEVVGFVADEGLLGRLPDSLAEQIRGRNLRIEADDL